ncbi:alpha/beta hydrolase [Arcanobacterium hippocoleae]|uniref:alpha/beta hydrolase n=1 Tax=Arcanobacterium hippocoleae TaxID=149017 RepID=UPI003342D720
MITDLASLDVASEEVEKYGVHPDQFIEWYGPITGRVVVAVHGFTETDNRLSYLRPAALALGDAGYRVALVEYRQMPHHPEITFEDIATLARHPRLQNAIWFGHSIGSLCVLKALYDPENSIKHCVVAAPIMNLRREVEEEETSNSQIAQTITQWMGGSPNYLPDTYAEYDPAVLYVRNGSADGFAANGYHLDIIHGSADQTIPVQHIKTLQAEPFNIAIVADANHNDVICPGHDAWLFLLGALG